jgi:hypothetical protein
MPKYNTYQVIFANNEISSVKQVEKPKFPFSDKVYISSTRFHLIFAFIKAYSINKAIQEAQKIIEKFSREK